MRRVRIIDEYERMLARGPRVLGVPVVPLAALAIANVIPLIGALGWGWGLRSVMLLYWAENVIVGFWALARMLTVGGVLAVPIGVFFCVHFGLFMFVHLMFVLGLTSEPAAPFDPFSDRAAVLAQVSLPALIALFVSHGISFARNFLIGGERGRTSVQVEMMRPYPRMAVMHVAIIAGAFFIMLLGQQTALLAILVLLKLTIDAASHVKEHRIPAGEEREARVTR